MRTSVGVQRSRDLPDRAPGVIRYRVRCLDKLEYPFRGDESLLDAGCGDGDVARLLRTRVQEVTAIDVEPSTNWRDAAGLVFRAADAEQLPFADDTFDLVHSKDSLHHMSSPERALSEYRRVLRPGGTALIIEANRYNPVFYPHMTLALRHQHFSRDHFHSLVHDAFATARFGAFEAHYAPALERVLRLQQAIEEGLERLRPFRPLLSYNFALAFD
jgi:ubiquinone/menaquinone biosynthesis C-methylase UbiE